MRTGSIKSVGAYDRVCNDECTFSFDTPFSAEGVYVSMTSYQAFGDEYVQLDHERTGNKLYVRIKHTRVAKPPPAEAEADKAAPTKVGIGVAGGFSVGEDKWDIVKENALVHIGDGGERLVVPLPCQELPELIINACNALINHKSHLTEEQHAAVAWEVEVKESRYANDLVQLPATKKISPNPKDWVCEESGMRENLWLNLSDGHIGSGRRQYDGSGGSNGALDHYKVTQRTHSPGFPLVVKLGTITPHGADVYSYAADEDNEVRDPKLAEHLAHWGINMMSMEKTEMSVAEINIAANEKLELDKITEAGKDLAPLSGPGYVGLRNLGNSCYMNSVLQVLFATPELDKAFGTFGASIMRTSPEDPSNDLLTQLAKLRGGLLTARYAESGESEEAVCVQPRMLKNLVGKGHPEFSSSRQQDAQEYLQHVLTLLQRSERTAGARLPEGSEWPSLASLFTFGMEERIEVDGQACYKPVKGCTQVLLPIPLEAASNKAEVDAYEARSSAAKRRKLEEGSAQDVSDAAAGGEAGGAAGGAAGQEEEEPVIPIVPFDACLAKLLAPAPLDNFRGRTGATKVTKLASFPKYLCFQLARYYTTDDWQAKKMAVSVPMPTSLDLTAVRASGPQDGEALLPDDEPAAAGGGGGGGGGGAAAAVEPDEAIVAQLLSMGFSENGCKRAALATKNSNAEAAMEWVFAHMEDPDFNEPLPPPEAPAGGGGGGGGAASAPDPEAIAMLGAMGFTEHQAKGALAATSGNLERAADWLFSHADDMDAAVAQALGEGSGGGGGGGGGGGAAEEAAVSDGPGKYELLGIISHMGSNTACGHYVAHIRKAGEWVLYNDRKVAKSETPPLDLGYMYVYARVDA
jgi:ubiquitin carboxyl-terminal hydrolase 5/13